MKLISVIGPANTARVCVDELARRLGAVFDSLAQYEWEAIIIENGSLDDTYERLLAIHERDPRFKIVQLARNFRMDGGITAGLNYASGDAAVIMTADLQDPPELIPEFVAKWEEGYENIYGIVTERQGTGPIRTFNSKAFYWLAGKLTSDRIPRNASDFRLVDRRVYETVRGMEERNRFIRGLFAWSGFRSIGVEHKREPRYGGVSNAHSFGVVDLAMKGIFAHSYVPLKVISLFGVALSLLSFVVLVALSLRFLFLGVPFAGFGTIVGLILLLFGFLFTMLGIVSEYIGLIYEEVKQRPNFIVRETLGLEDRQPADARGRDGSQRG